jgi:hypothetical protein
MCGLCGVLSFDDRPCDREIAAATFTTAQPCHPSGVVRQYF